MSQGRKAEMNLVIIRKMSLQAKVPAAQPAAHRRLQPPASLPVPCPHSLSFPPGLLRPLWDVIHSRWPLRLQPGGRGRRRCKDVRHGRSSVCSSREQATWRGCGRRRPDGRYFQTLMGQVRRVHPPPPCTLVALGDGWDSGRPSLGF
jgi:hypothetical protein